MATRPIFIPLQGRAATSEGGYRGALVDRLDLSIKWHPGFAISQKQKNIMELHNAAEKQGVSPVLEVSTKSTEELGRRLSAFNLKIAVHGVEKSLESVYQSSKVFSISGQHEILMDVEPFKVKRAVRELGRGKIVAFRFEGKEYPTEPKNAFYDWLYIKAMAPYEDWLRRNLHYAGYSDIEFTPEKSINCQARAVAEFHALAIRDAVSACTFSFEAFKTLLMYSQRDVLL